MMTVDYWYWFCIYISQCLIYLKMSCHILSALNGYQMLRILWNAHLSTSLIKPYGASEIQSTNSLKEVIPTAKSIYTIKYAYKH